jgi:hypothetical protein
MAVVLLTCAVLVVVLYTVFRKRQEKEVAIEE